jgi:hypothetical protein
MTAKGWHRAFDEPIVLPDGGELRTLADAGRYVDKLPRGMHEREEWQAVMEVLLSAVEGREPVSLLRIALTLALQESGPDERATALMRPIINAVESALGFNRVVLAARLPLPVFPNEQTFSGAVDMSQRCQNRKSSNHSVRLSACDFRCDNYFAWRGLARIIQKRKQQRPHGQ